MKVTERFFDRFLFLSRSLRLNRALGLGQIIVLSFDNPALAFGLGDVEIRYIVLCFLYTNHLVIAIIDNLHNESICYASETIPYKEINKCSLPQ